MSDQTKQRKGKILAIDYGKKFVGLAVSDQDRMMAFGRGAIAVKDFLSLAEKIKKICQEEKIQEILIGLPIPENGTDTPQTLLIRRFADNLKNYLTADAPSGSNSAEALNHLVFSFIDESFTSFEAKQFLGEMGVKKSLQKATLDELAATFILRRYIDFY